MLYSNSVKILLVMQIGARRKCSRAGNLVQNNEDNASDDACTTNQTDIFVRIKYLKIALSNLFLPTLNFSFSSPIGY